MSQAPGLGDGDSTSERHLHCMLLSGHPDSLMDCPASPKSCATNTEPNSLKPIAGLYSKQDVCCAESKEEIQVKDFLNAFMGIIKALYAGLKPPALN